MLKKLLKLMTAAALSGFAAASTAADSNFLADELRGLHSDLTSAHQWVDSDIRANLSHRWKTAPGRLTDVGLNFAEAKLLGLSWVTDADLRQETDPDGKWTGFGASGTGLLWTGESFAFGMQPSAEWTAADGVDFASFGVFGRRALGDWGVIGANVFGDYSEDAENGAFSRWSLGADFQSALAEVRGNWYSGSAGFRERWSEAGRVFAYAPSGVDAELRLRWSGDSEWTGFAEYEKWDGRFGNADIQEVGYGLTYRPLGGGLLSGLRVDAGYRDSADSADGWDLRVGYSRVLGGDNSSQRLDFGFGVQSALVAAVERENEARVELVTIRGTPIMSAESRAEYVPLMAELSQVTVVRQTFDTPPYLVSAERHCRLDQPVVMNATPIGQDAAILTAAESDGLFGVLCQNLRMGGNANARSASNETPLHRAVGRNAMENVKLLLLATADVSLENNGGHTALDWAQMKYAEWTTAEQRATAKTIAMMLRAEGTECESITGLLCSIDYEAIFPDEHPGDVGILDSVIVRSDASGVVYQIRIPGVAEPARNWRWSVNYHHDWITIYADGKVSVREDAVLLGAAPQYFRMSFQRPEDRYPQQYHLRLTFKDVPRDEVWTTPKVRRVVPDYIGPLFTLTIFQPHENFLAGFGYNEGAAYYDESGFGYSLILRSSLHFSPVFLREFTSRSRQFQGKLSFGKLVIHAHNKILRGQPADDEIKGMGWYRNYSPTRVTFAFTVSAVDIPRRMGFTVTQNQTGRVGEIPTDGLGNVAYKVIGIGNELRFNQGEIRLASALSVGESAALTVELTSPDLIGMLTITAQVHGLCEKVDVDILLHSDDDDSPYQLKGNQLLNAASRGELVTLCRLLSEGADPNFRGDARSRPLDYGALDGDAAIARSLINYGAVANYAFGGDDYTPLHVSATRCEVEYSRVLLENGARTTRKIGSGDAPINAMAGGCRGQLDKFRKLLDLMLENGADINSRGNYGWTPLIRASASNDLEKARILLARGADKSITDRTGRNACAHTSRGRYGDAMRQLLMCPSAQES